jgi:hypothetical protein
MSLAYFAPLVALAVLSAFLQGFLGVKGQKEKGNAYDFRSYFPYELYGDSRSPLLLFARIFEALSLLGIIALPILLTVSYASDYQGYGTSFVSSLIISSSLFALSYFYLSLVPVQHEKLHLGVYFLTSALNTLNLSMEGYFLLLLIRHGTGKESLYALAALLFVIALVSILLPLNPRLKHWAEMDKVAEKDGSISFKRPKFFVLAWSEWLLYALSLLGYLFALLAFFLVSL